MTLLHFIVQTVREKFPEVQNFDSELRFIEKAAVGKIAYVFLQKISHILKDAVITRP